MTRISTPSRFWLPMPLALTKTSASLNAASDALSAIADPVREKRQLSLRAVLAATAVLEPE
jgi:hypothetical protein